MIASSTSLNWPDAFALAVAVIVAGIVVIYGIKHGRF